MCSSDLSGTLLASGSALGTPASGTLTNCTGLPLSTGVTGTLPVASGGTGSASATAYAVQCGGTTSTGAHQSVASLGTSGQVLTSSGAGALPTWTTISSGGMTLLGTISATAVNSISLTGLTLTSYKALFIVFNGVSNIGNNNFYI